MKPFNLEAAKRGDPFEVRNKNGEWGNASYIGAFSNGKICVESEHGVAHILFSDSANLRMAPKKVTWYCRIYLGDNTQRPELFKSLEPIEEGRCSTWLGDPFTIEVEE